MRGIGAGVRIFELLERNPAIDPTAGIAIDPARRGTIRFEDVTFRYPSRKEVTVLKDLNLEIQPGESVALVYVMPFIYAARPIRLQILWTNSGDSGSGKSSVNSLLLRYYDPVKGKITYDGQGTLALVSEKPLDSIFVYKDIREFNPASWRDIIGVVPQVRASYILINICFPVSHPSFRTLFFSLVLSRQTLLMVTKTLPKRKLSTPLARLIANLYGACRKDSRQKVRLQSRYRRILLNML
jgi:hypothetical protein